MGLDNNKNIEYRWAYLLHDEKKKNIFQAVLAKKNSS